MILPAPTWLIDVPGAYIFAAVCLTAMIALLAWAFELNDE